MTAFDSIIMYYRVVICICCFAGKLAATTFLSRFHYTDYFAMTKKLCCVSGCSRESRSLSRCHHHYVILWRDRKRLAEKNGGVDVENKRDMNPPRICKEDGCDRTKIVARGLCARCYNRQMRQAKRMEARQVKENKVDVVDNKNMVANTLAEPEVMLSAFAGPETHNEVESHNAESFDELNKSLGLSPAQIQEITDLEKELDKKRIDNAIDKQQEPEEGKYNSRWNPDGSPAICKVQNCFRQVRCRGLCAACYLASWRRRNKEDSNKESEEEGEIDAGYLIESGDEFHALLKAAPPEISGFPNRRRLAEYEIEELGGAVRVNSIYNALVDSYLDNESNGV